MSEPVNIIGEDELNSEQVMSDDLWLHIANRRSLREMKTLEYIDYSQGGCGARCEYEEMQFDDNLGTDKLRNGNTTNPIEDNFESLNGIIDIDDALERSSQFFTELQAAISERKDVKNPKEGSSTDCVTSNKEHAGLLKQWAAPDSTSDMEKCQHDLRRPVIGKAMGQKTDKAECSRSRAAPYPQQRMKSCKRCDPEKADSTEQRQGHRHCESCLKSFNEHVDLQKKIGQHLKEAEEARKRFEKSPLTPPRSPTLAAKRVLIEYN